MKRPIPLAAMLVTLASSAPGQSPPIAINQDEADDREDDPPTDQHMLVSLIAPRPVLILSASGDQWSDPKGEFLSAKGADPVDRLLGADGLGVRDMPGENVLVWGRIGYQIRPGKDDVTREDWDAVLDFAGRHLGRSATPR